MGISQGKQNLLYSRQFGYHEVAGNGVIKQYQLTSHEQQESFRNLVTMYRIFDVPTILPILASQPINNQNGIAFGWRLRFKHLSNTLQEQVNQMAKEGRRYTQQQILKIIDCVLSALMGFKLKKLSHGNINCENIFIDHDPENVGQPASNDREDSKKIYAIGLPLLLNLNDQERVVSQKEYHKLYLSPLSLLQISEGKNKLSVTQKNDVFSLGLLVLRLMLLFSIHQLYDFEHLKLKEVALERKMFECRQLYSATLCDMVSMMTERSEKSRPDFQQVFNYCYSLMEKYEKNQTQIENQQQVGDESTPVKKTDGVSQQVSSNKKNKAQVELFQKKVRADPDPLYPTSPQLAMGFQKSKQSGVAWSRFKNRMMNRSMNMSKEQDCK